MRLAARRATVLSGPGFTWAQIPGRSPAGAAAQRVTLAYAGVRAHPRAPRLLPCSTPTRPVSATVDTSQGSAPHIRSARGCQGAALRTGPTGVARRTAPRGPACCASAAYCSTTLPCSRTGARSAICGRGRRLRRGDPTDRHRRAALPGSTCRQSGDLVSLLACLSSQWITRSVQSGGSPILSRGVRRRPAVWPVTTGGAVGSPGRGVNDPPATATGDSHPGPSPPHARK